MNHAAVLQTLSERPCSSIRYRTQRDILGADIHSQALQSLQEQILQDEAVQAILCLQREDGWLGGYFHDTEREPESGIRFLCEKGVEGDHPVIQAALQAILARGDDFDRGCMEKIAKPLDDRNLGGSRMMKACVFAYARQEDHDFVREEIHKALDSFAATLLVKSPSELYTLHKDKEVFRENMTWPTIYHLRLLADTSVWRTRDNQALLTRAVRHMMELGPIPNIRLLHKNQLIAPPQSNFMSDLSRDLPELSDKEWMIWLHRTECIARLGIAAEIPSLKQQLLTLKAMLEENDGWFVRPLRHFYFNKWTTYIGLALENSWRSKQSRIHDLTFRSLLILHHANLLA